MLIKLPSSVLSTVLKDINSIIPSHPSSPILGAVLITADDEGIWLWGTDLDVSGRFLVEGTIEIPGKAALPAKRLSEMVRQLPMNEEMFLEIAGGKAEIKCGRSKFVMPAMAEEDFPVFPEIGSPDKVIFSSMTLEKLVNGTAFAAGREESRPGLNSVLWELADNGMSMVATDGRRLAWMKVTLKEPTRLERKFILPPKALNQAVKLAAAADEVTVGFGDRFVRFELPGAILYTRELDTSYPSYSTVIPKETALAMVVKKADLAAALKRAIIFAMPLTSQIRIELEVGKMVVHAECPEIGEATEELDVEYSGERFQIGFNGKYLLDVLSHIDTERVRFKMNAPLKAALIVPEDADEGESYTCLLMPLRLNE